jgi:transposase
MSRIFSSSFCVLESYYCLQPCPVTGHCFHHTVYWHTANHPSKNPGVKIRALLNSLLNHCYSGNAYSKCEECRVKHSTACVYRNGFGRVGWSSWLVACARRTIWPLERNSSLWWIGGGRAVSVTIRCSGLSAFVGHMRRAGCITEGFSHWFEYKTSPLAVVLSASIWFLFGR